MCTNIYIYIYTGCIPKTIKTITGLYHRVTGYDGDSWDIQTVQVGQHLTITFGNSTWASFHGDLTRSHGRLDNSGSDFLTNQPRLTFN